MDFSTKTPSHLTSLSSWNLESGEMWNVDFKSATTPSTPSTAFNQLPKDKTATQQGLWREGTVQLGIFLKSPKNTKRVIWIYRTFEWTSQLLRLLTDLSKTQNKNTKKNAKCSKQLFWKQKNTHFRRQNTTRLRAVGQVQGAACRTLQRIYANAQISCVKISSVIHTYDVTSCYLWHRSWYNLFIDPMKFDSCFDSFLSWNHEVILYDAFLIQWSEFNDFNDCGVISFFVKIWTFFKCLERNQYSVLLVGRTFVTYWSLMIAYDHLRRLVSE